MALEPVGTSYRAWADSLRALAAGRVGELGLWQEALREPDGLLGSRALDPVVDVAATAGSVTVEVPAEVSQGLLSWVPGVWGAGVEEVLLAALGVAVSRWRDRRRGGGGHVLVDLEGHGREQLLDGWDLSRTVGWFTSRYPVRLDVDGVDVGAAVKRVKETLRGLPDRGMGFGLLRYLDPGASEALAGLAEPQVGFNYLGRFRSGGAGGEGDWLPVGESGGVGGGVDPSMRMPHAVEVNALALDGADGPVLSAVWAWPGGVFGDGEVEELARLWVGVLEALVQEAGEPGAGGLTPSDVLAEVSQAEIEALEATYPGLDDVLPLAPLQEGLHFHALYDTESPDLYTIQLVFDLEGDLDTETMRRAAAALLRRRPNLRAGFLNQESGRPVQVVPAVTEVPWTDVDLRGIGAVQQEDLADTILDEDRAHRFDPARPPLLRFTAIRLGDNRHRLVLTNHHLLWDGWSVPVVVRELFELYAHGGDGAHLAPAPQFREHLDWLAAQDRPAAEEAWRTALAGLDEPTLLAEAFGTADSAGAVSSDERAPDSSGLPERLSVRLPQSFTAELHTWARSRGLTVNTVLQGAWALLLARLTGREDVVFGATVSGRPADLPGVEDMTGLFSNTLPVRVALERARALSLVGLLEQIQDQQAELMDHHHVGLSGIAARTGLGELFDTLLVFENYPLDPSTLDLPGTGLRATDARVRDAAHYPLSLAVVPGDELELRFDYRPERFTADRVEAIGDRLHALLGLIVTEPDRPVGRVGVLTDAEAEQLVQDRRQSRRYVELLPFPDLFEMQAARTPDTVAVVYEETEDHSVELTYAELDARANRLARLLIERGIGPEDIVGLLLPRSVDQVVAVLAVAKAGAAYLPIDPAHPAERIAYVVGDARPVLLLVDAVTGRRLPELDTGTPALVLGGDIALRRPGHRPAADERRAPLTPDSPAYVIYTSGSTGRPKGVVVTHRGVANLAGSQIERFAVEEGSRILQVASPSFDAAFSELCLALLSGSTLVLAPADRLLPGAGRSGLAGVIARQRITHATISPAALAALDDDGLPAGMVLTVAGEACSAALVDRWSRDRRMINAYGPTETTVCATMSEPLAPSDRRTPPPIGRAVWNTHAYVLDASLGPVVPGVAGELYVSGPGLARGYLGRPDLTASRFVADPFAADGSRMYRTGDVVRQLPNGELEFVGRVDDQVKLRGFRIELGEIEAAVLESPAVDQAAVIVREDRPGVRAVVAYVVPEAGAGGAGSAVDVAALRERVAAALPEYMVPSAFVVLDALPLTVHGKLDRRALPVPELVVGGRGPRSAREEILCGLFGEVLGVEGVGVEDGFFDLGGHSLLATRLVSRVRSVLGVELPVRALFEHPTVAALDRTLDDAAQARRALTPLARPAQVPLSFGQRRLWFLERFESAGGSVSLAVRLTGELDADALRLALGDLVARHEALRTVFPDDDGVPRQQVLDFWVPGLGLVDVTEDEVAGELRDAVSVPVDLAVDPPLRARLLRLGEREHVLSLVVHHIAADGWSLAPLARDLSAAYAARLAGGVPEWRPLPVQFADYTVWQREVLGDETDPESPIARQLSYWYETLSGLPDEIDLPADRPRPPVPGYRGGTVEFAFDAGLHGRLTALAREANVSLFMVVQAGLAALLHRLGAGSDIPLGTPVAGRTDEALDDLVGFFVNTLVLRTDVSGDPTFRELLERVRETDLAAYAHQDVPFERLVEVLNPARSLARHPLFQVMLALQNAPEAALRLPGLSVEPLPPAQGDAKFDLGIELVERHGPDGAPDGLQGLAHYSADRFDEDTVRLLTDRFGRWLAAAAEAPGTRVGALDVLSAAERDTVLHRWNATGHDLPDSTLPALFEAQAARTPDAVAVVAGDQELTYAELNARSNRLARLLAGRGAGPESLVAVAVPRSVSWLVAFLAVAKAGAGYLPVDPAQPGARIERMIADARPVLVLTEGADGEDASAFSAAPLAVSVAALRTDEAERLAADLAATDLTDGERTTGLRPEHPAYVIYTSGSTGVPKGVVVTHGSIGNLAAVHIDRLDVDGASRVLQAVSTTFDPSVADTVMALLSGAALVLADPRRHVVGDQLAEAIDRYAVTHVQLAAPVLATVPDAGLDTLRCIVTGGEACSAELVARWARGGRRVVNAYGPTEMTVATTMTGPLTGASTPPIGRAVWNTRAYVLDASLGLVAPGVAGELYVAGAGLARGYLGRPDLTASRFVADPFAVDGSRMYRTGDVVRQLPDGQFEFVGRADDQVKIRGHRIEPGEVEAVVAAADGVGQAAVVVREDPARGAYLVAYAVPGSTGADGALDVSVLRERVAGVLPEYMVPSAFVVLDALPLTVHGKLDRRALPVPELVVGGRGPRSAREEILCGLFGEVLGVEGVGVEDGFFDLGGHSLLATRLVSRVRSVLGVELPVRALFEHPTVAALDRTLDDAGTARTALAPADRPDAVPLSFAQRRLWFLNRFEENSSAYNVPMAVRLTGELDPDALRRALGDVLARHEALRTVFPDDRGRPRQLVLPAGLPDVRVEPAAEDGLSATLAEAANTGFALDRELPLRVRVFRTGEQEHVLLLVLHHIAADGWSLAPLARDLSAAYTARLAGEAPRWRPLPVQYADYTVWQREVLGDEGDPESPIARQLSHWYETLSGLPDEIALPADRPRPQTPSRIAGSVGVDLPAAVHGQLTALAREANVSLFMVVQAGLAALLHRLGAGDDIPLGSLIAGRTDEALDDLVGFFVNTLVLRTDVSGDPTFRELLERVREADLAAYAHQDVPFERLVEVLNPTRSLARHPLFQVMLSFQNAENAELALPGLSVEPLRIGLDAAKFDLSFNLEERLDASGAPDGIGGRIEFAAELFDAETVETVSARLVRLLSAVAADPGRPVGALDIAGPGELERVVAEWGRGRGELPVSDATPAALFAAQAARTPDATAVVAADATLTFAELDARAGRLAGALAARGVTAECLVATALPRSAALVTAILAVLKAGGGYVPLDPAHPAERIGRILDRTRPRLVLTGPDGLPDGVRTGVEVLTPAEVLTLSGPADQEDATGTGTGTVTGATDARIPDASAVRPDAPAYVIHTSGSTGTPKGVVVSHRSLSGLFRSMRERVYGPSSGGAPLRAAHFASFSFDASVDQLLWLFDGHELHLLDEDTRTDPERLLRYLADHRVDALSTTPSYAARLVDRGLLDLPHGLRALALGAEAVPEPLWRRLAATPGLAAFNLYGPTECTVDSVVARIGAGRPVIGRPVPDTAALVLDGRLRPVLPGVTGELYLSGPALARGYVREPALTAGRFVACPYGPAGRRMYRTGDLVRWRDGQLEYVGRADDQVKIRGFRVELGEVESALAGRTGVLQAAAVVREDRPGVRQLAAYAVARPGVPLDPARLRAELARELPDYMVPATVTVLDALPLTTSGKVDRRALPAPRTGGDSGGRAPRPGREELLARLFAEVLGRDEVDAESSFFDLGGDSIVSIELVSRARAHRLVISPRDVFRHRTVAALAAAATEQEGVGGVDPEDIAVGDVEPLPIVHDLWQRGGPSDGVNQATLLTVPPDLGEERLVAAVRTLLDHHGALRLRLTVDGEERRLTVGAPGSVAAGPLVRRCAVAEADGERLAELIRSEGEAARGRLAPEAGVLVQAVWFDAGPDRSGRLLLVLHHLAVDGVSWRILVPDLVTAWQATAGLGADGSGASGLGADGLSAAGPDGGKESAPAAAAATAVLPPEGTSFRRWTQHLVRLAEDPARLAELPLWRRMSAGPDPRLGSRPLDPARDTVSSLRSVTVELAADRTEPLLTTVPSVFRAGVNDVLLTALTLALAHWRERTGRERGTGALVELESHGREDLVDGVDLSRTVGWFTSSHPLWLDPGPLDVAEALAAGPAAGRALKRVKEQLRAVPDHGIGYGLLRRLNAATAAELSGAPAPQIGFNYLGRFSADPVGGHWTPAPETGALPDHADPASPLPHVLEINAAAHDGADGPRLSTTLSWPDGLLTEAEVRELAESWLRALEALVTHARNPDAGGWTPSDVALTSLTQSQIDHVLAGDDEDDEEDEEDDMDSFWRDAR
ncbi:amino acid adenylation domain-containing protein [Streptomyces sp. 43Y-GA-1]|uniref:amino acid adenylation domain-containing protein n=1 Tax=Streptomyces sp. 43Y-GA-1 TaxID=2939435 RepID=UPI0034D48DED